MIKTAIVTLEINPQPSHRVRTGASANTDGSAPGQTGEQQDSSIDSAIQTIDETIAAAANEGAQNPDADNLEGGAENQQQENDESANLL